MEIFGTKGDVVLCQEMARIFLGGKLEENKLKLLLPQGHQGSPTHQANQRFSCYFCWSLSFLLYDRHKVSTLVEPWSLF